MTVPALRVAFYTGLYVHRDAISASVGHKVELLDRQFGPAVEIAIFTQHSDIDEPRVIECPTVQQLVTHGEFWDADIHIFEFGIYFGLFDAVFLVPDGVPTVAVYHNITPLEWVEDPEVRAAVERSLVQKHNLARFDQVISVGDLGRQDLIDFGVPADDISVVHLPPNCEIPTVRPERRTAERSELLFVGRFVKPKGVIQLIEAVRRLAEAGRRDFHLTMIGNARFAEAATRAALDFAVASDVLASRVTIIEDASDQVLGEAYAKADALVMPSFHEGYCVPVVEAYHAGCHVVGFASGNLPAVTGGLARLVEPGDVDGLTDAISGFLDERIRWRSEGDDAMVRVDAGEFSQAEWHRRLDDHMAGYTRERFEAGILDVLSTCVRLPEVADQ